MEGEKISFWAHERSRAETVQATLAELAKGSSLCALATGHPTNYMVPEKVPRFFPKTIKTLLLIKAVLIPKLDLLPGTGRSHQNFFLAQVSSVSIKMSEHLEEISSQPMLNPGKNIIVLARKEKLFKGPVKALSPALQRSCMTHSSESGAKLWDPVLFLAEHGGIILCWFLLPHSAH